MQPKKQLKVQYIGIFEEINSFYWPKMHFLKEGQKIRAWVDPPLIQAMPERKRFFSIEAFPYVILFGPVFLSLHAKTILLKSTRLLIARMLCCHS